MRSCLSAFVVSLVCLFAVPALAAPAAPMAASDQSAPAAENPAPRPGKEKKAPAQEKEASRPAQASSYSGNTKSRVFHASNCRYFTCKTCPEHFTSAEEAKKNGYKPCKRCIR